jgi:hypothetical protein
MGVSIEDQLVSVDGFENRGLAMEPLVSKRATANNRLRKSLLLVRKPPASPAPPSLE